MVLLPGATGLGLKVTVVPGGLFAAVSVIGLLNPPKVVVPNVIDIVGPAGQGDVAGGGLVNPNPNGGAEIWKFEFEISKKIFPTASILILAVVVILFGTTMLSVPSFGVLAAITIGNV